MKRNVAVFKILPIVEGGGGGGRQTTYNCSIFPKDWSKLMKESQK